MTTHQTGRRRTLAVLVPLSLTIAVASAVAAQAAPSPANQSRAAIQVAPAVTQHSLLLHRVATTKHARAKAATAEQTGILITKQMSPSYVQDLYVAHKACVIAGIRTGQAEQAAAVSCAALQPISLLDQDIATDPNYSAKYDAWIGCLVDAGTKLTTSPAEKATGSFTLVDSHELDAAPIGSCERRAFGFVS